MKKLLWLLALLALAGLMAASMAEGGTDVISIADLCDAQAGARFDAAPSVSGALSDDGTADMTVMVYICGSNLESGVAHWATRDLAEMFGSGFDESRVNLVLALGGAAAWESNRFPTNCVTELYCRPARGVASIINSQYGASMGDAGTLSTFLRDAVAACPARRYVLVIWNHGGGPVDRLCVDELFDDGLYTQELVEALADSPFGPEQKLEWIGMNACLMGSAEIGSALAPYADYLFASEDVLIAPDFDYGFLRDLVDQDAETAGRAIVDGYFDSYEKFWMRYGGDINSIKTYTSADRTMSVIDLSKMDAVEQAVDALFSAAPSPADEGDFIKLARARSDALEFGLSSGVHLDLVDLESLADAYSGIAPDQSAALKAAVSDAVVYNRTNIDGASGLSIYYPHSNQLYYYYLWGAQMAANDFGGSYRAFMEAYLDKLYEDTVNWSGVFDTLTVVARDDGEGCTAMVSLTGEQIQYAYSAQLITLQGSRLLDSSGGYHLMGHQQKASLIGDTLVVDFDGKAMALMDGSGNVVSAINSVWRDGYYFVSASLQDRSIGEFDGTERVQCVWLVLRENGAGGLDLVNIVPCDRNEVAPSDDKINASFSGLTLDSDMWPVIYLTGVSVQPRYDEAGRITPADTWPSTDDFSDPNTVLSMQYVDNTQPWQLGFTSIPDDIYGRYAQLVITDICGRRHASPLVPLPNRCKLAAAQLNEQLYAEGDISVTLSEISLVRDDINGHTGMLFTLDIENPTDGQLFYGIANLAFNGTPQMTRLSWTDDEGNAQSIDTNAGISWNANPQSSTRISLFLDWNELVSDIPEHIDRIAFDTTFALYETDDYAAGAAASFEGSVDLAVDLDARGMKD